MTASYGLVRRGNDVDKQRLVKPPPREPIGLQGAGPLARNTARRLLRTLYNRWLLLLLLLRMRMLASPAKQTNELRMTTRGMARKIGVRHGRRRGDSQCVCAYV